MSRKREFTEDEINFIKENRLTLSVTKMSIELKLGYNVVRNFMVDNDLLLTA